MKNVLVLGGNGYLGSKIINKLLTADNVFCTIKKGESLNLLEKKKNIHVVSNNLDEIKEVIAQNRIDVLINTVCCYERNGTPLSNVVDANLVFPISVIPYAIENGINKIITIDTSLPENVNLYSMTKKTIANIGKYYCENYQNITFYNILLENFYGKDEPKNRFLHIMVDKLKKNEPLELTSGTQRRDFIYIDDVLSAFEILLSNNDVGYHNIPVGTGEGPTIKEVICYLKKITDSKSVLDFGAVASRINEPDCISNLEYLTKFGYKVKYPYKVGLKEII